MVIGVISDTHGNLAGWQRAWELALSEADVIIHCGDLLYHGPKFKPVEGYDPKGLAEAINNCGKPVLVARGNGDSDVDQLVIEVPIQQPYLFAVLDGLRVLATHGHLMTPEELEPLAEKWGVGIVLTGHTHVPVARATSFGIRVNPGTVTYPLSQDEALKRRTFAMIADGQARVIALQTGETVLSVDLPQ